jgi:hypothetical protein
MTMTIKELWLLLRNKPVKYRWANMSMQNYPDGDPMERKMSERYVDGGGNIPVLSRKVADGMVLHPLSEIREWDEALAVLGIQDSTQTPAEAIRELIAEIERLRGLSFTQAGTRP